MNFSYGQEVMNLKISLNFSGNEDGSVKKKECAPSSGTSETFSLKNFTGTVQLSTVEVASASKSSVTNVFQARIVTPQKRGSSKSTTKKKAKKKLPLLEDIRKKHNLPDGYEVRLMSPKSKKYVITSPGGESFTSIRKASAAAAKPPEKGAEKPQKKSRSGGESAMAAAAEGSEGRKSERLRKRLRSPPSGSQNPKIPQSPERDVTTECTSTIVVVKEGVEEFSPEEIERLDWACSQPSEWGEDDYGGAGADWSHPQHAHADAGYSD